MKTLREAVTGEGPWKGIVNTRAGGRSISGEIMNGAGGSFRSNFLDFSNETGFYCPAGAFLTEHGGRD